MPLYVLAAGRAGAEHLTSKTSRTVAHAPVAAHLEAPAAVPTETPLTEPAPAKNIPDPTKVAVALTGALQQQSSATWSVAVYDITNQQWLAQVNAGQQIRSASLYKLYAVYALSKIVPFDQWGSRVVADQPMSSCVDKMLRLSDNTCGEAIGRFVGWRTIDKYDRAYGFSGTNMNASGGPATTASDATTFMSDLYQGKIFDAATTSFVLNSLQHQLFNKGIPAGCPGCTVYNKTGSDPGISHDSAIVTSGDLTYAVTIMSKGGSSAQIAQIERALQAALQTQN